jgi:hypothetical protein
MLLLKMVHADDGDDGDDDDDDDDKCKKWRFFL